MPVPETTALNDWLAPAASVTVEGVTVTAVTVVVVPPPIFPEPPPHPVMRAMVKTAPRQISRDAKMASRRRNCLPRMVVLLFCSIFSFKSDDHGRRNAPVFLCETIARMGGDVKLSGGFGKELSNVIIYVRII